MKRKLAFPAWSHHVHGALLDAIPCVPAVALILVAGLLSHHVSSALIAASAAMAIGFGGFKNIEGSPLPVTVLASGGSALAAITGSLIGHSLPALAAATLVTAALTTFLASVNEASRWITLQSTITLLVAGNFPESLDGAIVRGALILAGGALELAFVSGLQWALGTARHPFRPIAAGRTFVRGLVADARFEVHRNLTHSGLCGLAVALSLLTSRALDVPKSYWAPMTTLIVLKADYRSVGRRGLWRLVGTLLGGIVGALIGFAHLATHTTLFLTIALLFLTYALQNAQYGIYVGIMTTWLIVMLGLGQHFEPSVAWHRAIFTFLGGGLAIAAELPRAAIHRRSERSTSAKDNQN